MTHGRLIFTNTYEDGDELTLGHIKIHVIATPGHTPGGVCLLAGDWLFSGDTLFAGSCGRTDFKGGDQQKLVGSLSGGERGRLHLAKTLLAGGNVLLLDEPSNDLDVETLRALEEALLEFAGCALVTSHDRWFLDRIATHILAFEGDSRVVFFDGNYNEYEADKRRRLGEEACQPKRLRFKPLKH